MISLPILEFKAVFGCVALIPRDEQLCSWHRSSIVLSFRGTGNALTGLELRAIFPSLTFLKSLPVLKEYAC